MAKQQSASSPVDSLMEGAAAALSDGQYFGAERTAAEALRLAHQKRDFARMSSIVLTLQEARRQRRQIASSVRKIRRMSDEEELRTILEGNAELTRGCYLLEPMLVAADGRDLREKAGELGVEALIVVREPKTQLGLWPVVMVGPETVRTQVHPPKRISVSWMLSACEAMGREAIGRVDTEASPAEQVDHLMYLLETVVDSEDIHQALEEACRSAAHGTAPHSKASV